MADFFYSNSEYLSQRYSFEIAILIDICKFPEDIALLVFDLVYHGITEPELMHADEASKIWDHDQFFKREAHSTIDAQLSEVDREDSPNVLSRFGEWVDMGEFKIAEDNTNLWYALQERSRLEQLAIFPLDKYFPLKKQTSRSPVRRSMFPDVPRYMYDKIFPADYSPKSPVRGSDDCSPIYGIISPDIRKIIPQLRLFGYNCNIENLEVTLFFFIRF